MYVKIEDVYTIKSGVYTFKFDNKITRYLEFSDLVVIYFEDVDTITAMELSENENGVSKIRKAWEFKKDPILEFIKEDYEGKDVVRVRTNSPFHDMLYLLNPSSGEIILQTPTR